MNKNEHIDPSKNLFPRYFERKSQDVIRSAYTSDILWGKIDLFNSSTSEVDKILFFDSALSGFVTFYYRGEEYYAGSSIPLSLRNRPEVYPSLKIKLAPKERSTVFFKQHGHHALSMNVFIAEEVNYFLFQTERENSYRYYAGAIVGLLCYNFILALFFKSRKYIIYCIFTTSFLIAVLNLNGVLDYFPFFISGKTFTHYLIVTSSIASALALFFGFTFLEAKKYIPFLIPFKNVLLGLVCLPIILVFTPVYSSYITYFGYYIDSLIAVILSFLIISCVVAIQKDSPLAKGYIVSWTCVALGAFLYFGNKYSFLPKNILTENGFLLGNLFEMIVLSLALAYQSAVLEKENNEVLIKAEEKEKYQHLLRTISHDISNSLQVLVLGTRRLMKMVDDERVLKVTQKMQHSTRNVVEILEQVKTQEKLLLDKKAISLSKVRLQEIVNEVILIYEDILIQKNIIVKIDIPSDIKLIKAEKVSLKNNILGNILSNAVKFSHHNSEIKITAKNEEDQVLLKVRDYGVGFSEEALEFINKDFEMTFSTLGTEGESGTGFGLRIIKSYIKMFEGDLKAYNDGGAVFELRFKT